MTRQRQRPSWISALLLRIMLAVGAAAVIGFADAADGRVDDGMRTCYDFGPSLGCASSNVGTNLPQPVAFAWESLEQPRRHPRLVYAASSQTKDSTIGGGKGADKDIGVLGAMWNLWSPRHLWRLLGDFPHASVGEGSCMSLDPLPPMDDACEHVRLDACAVHEDAHTDCELLDTTGLLARQPPRLGGVDHGYDANGVRVGDGNCTGRDLAGRTGAYFDNKSGEQCQNADPQPTCGILGHANLVTFPDLRAFRADCVEDWLVRRERTRACRGADALGPTWVMAERASDPESSYEQERGGVPSWWLVWAAHLTLPALWLSCCGDKEGGRRGATLGKV